MSVLEVPIQLTNEKLIHAYNVLKRHNDIENARKMIDLYEKKQNDEFIISFSGHFSAGKSSILNYLIGKDILPNSPIPTSANIVKISSGEGVVKVFFKQERAVEYAEPYDIDVIKDYCMNKDSIERIEISTKEHIVPERCAFLDTPGIDAADDTDRMITESALHTVDVLFYVMDYNHVQSEVNLYFLQEIQAQKIPFYIVINQIDKHNEREISFSQFDRHVKETFSQWNVTPEAIFYTSIYDRDNERNELKRLKTYIYYLFTKHRSIEERLITSYEKIMLDHETFLNDEYENELSKLGGKTDNNISIDQLTKQKEVLERKASLPNAFEKEFEYEVNETLKNAYLMPASLRDLAANFLEAEQKGFKVGFFNAKRKTEHERSARLEAFLNELEKTIETTIQWNLREKLLELTRAYEINDEHIIHTIQTLSVSYEKNDVRAFINPGATYNGTYVLNYTNEVSNDIKKKFRQKTREILEVILEKMNARMEKEREEINEEQQSIETLLKQAEQKKELKEQYDKKLHALKRVDEIVELNETVKNEIEQIILEKSLTVRETIPVQMTKELEKPLYETEKVVNVEELPTHSLEKVVQTIDHVVGTIDEIEGFDTFIEELKKKRALLTNREVTVALFGAFSAGKSSFSNALLGERILPVSPNPTTAVISRIRPATKDNEHGTVTITLKDEKVLLSDIANIVKNIDNRKRPLSEMIEWIKNEKIDESELISNVYQAYLRAIVAGYDERKDELGSSIQISLTEFPIFVTDETKACFIDTVDVYYDCALTQKGITLVDTPGADSVNARHTNVAFDFIKEADAIVYVTYYNHAITRADRDFLVQLGRVKESFELDKMFFIVNASDLAKNEAELQLVLDFVEKELISFGIRDAKIFPLSSKKSLEEKLNQQTINQEMETFEKVFYQFIEEKLTTLTIQSAEWDIKRTISTLKQRLDAMKLDEENRVKRIETLNKQKLFIEKRVTEKSHAPLMKRLEERIERQLHFVLERLYIRFHDMFTEHFNPTTITDSGRAVYKQLEKARNQFVDYVGYELLQEVRAVTLRIEAYMKEYLREFHKEVQQEIKAIDLSLIIPSLQQIEFASPEYERAFTTIDMQLFAKALRSFKNLRSFFEENDRETMKEMFYETMKPLAETYINDSQNMMKEAYETQLNQAIKDLKQTIITDLIRLIEQEISVLENFNDAELIERKYEELKQYVMNIKKDE